jgi:hypothetical protein
MAHAREQRSGRERPMNQLSPPATGWFERFFGVAARWDTWAALIYLLVSFPLALGSWIALVTLVAVGGGLAITVVGIPLLFFTMLLWCFYADLERILANGLLRTRIRPLPFAREGDQPWIWPRVRARLKNSYTWRALGFLLFIRFPLGLTGFFVLSFTVGTACQWVISGLFVAGGGKEHVFGVFEATTVTHGITLIVLGLLIFAPSLHVVAFAGRLTGRILTACLQSPEGLAGPMEGTSLDRAVTAAVLWPGVVRRRFASPRVRSVQIRVWEVHLALYLVVTLVLVVINALATPGEWWFVWPAWGWGMPLALHTGYLLAGHLGGHAALFAVANLGFFAIDSSIAGETWFFWPLVSWAIALAAHVYLFLGFSPIDPEPFALAPASLQPREPEPPVAAAGRPEPTDR